ncbi:MAG: VanZ family protein, partial [Atopobiaceae bacterium]|nr:VanZ family protein [Atopobiaceae bacterium]
MARHAARRDPQDEGRLAWKVLLVLWMVFIWVHSLIPGPASSEESMLFVRLVYPLFKAVGIADMDVAHLIVRKGAHFSEYLVLGFITIVALRPRLAVPLFPAVLTVILWVAVPSVDEFIQLHVPGRAGMVTDVLIDMAGFAVGMVIARIVQHQLDTRARRQAEREQRERQKRAERYVRRARQKARERARAGAT